MCRLGTSTNIICIHLISYQLQLEPCTGELGYDGPLYDGFLHMTDDMLGPSRMHIKYSSYVYDGFCIQRTNFSGPIESVISKFTCMFISYYLTSSRYYKCPALMNLDEGHNVFLNSDKFSVYFYCPASHMNLLN